jgi:hypothetical protein
MDLMQLQREQGRMSTEIAGLIELGKVRMCCARVHTRICLLCIWVHTCVCTFACALIGACASLCVHDDIMTHTRPSASELALVCACARVCACMR